MTYTHTRLVMALTELDRQECEQERKRRIKVNMWRLSHYLQAAQDMRARVGQGEDPTKVYADIFVPTRGMHKVARILELPLDVEEGRWVFK